MKKNKNMSIIYCYTKKEIKKNKYGNISYIEINETTIIYFMGIPIYKKIIVPN